MCVTRDSAVVQRALAMKYNYYARMRMLCVHECVQIGWVGLRREESEIRCQCLVRSELRWT